MNADIVTFLRSIPQSNQDACTIEAISSGENLNFLRGVVFMLNALGAVQIDGDERLKATSQTAKYLLHSLASYIESGQPIIDDWHTRGVSGSKNDNPLQTAVTLLHVLETNRLERINNPQPTRTVKVAQVLIKRSNPHTGEPELLFQYDDNASQYQLIGGRHSNEDEDILTTMIREIEEEVEPLLTYRQDYELERLAESLTPPASISQTFGALTQYHFWIYHMIDLKKTITLQDSDKWVPINYVRAGYIIEDSGNKVAFASNAIFELIDAAIPGGLDHLADSFRI